MALVTIHRSPTPSNCPAENLSADLFDVTCDVESNIRSPHRSQSFSESYLAVKGAALILPQSEGTRTVNNDSQRGDIGCHLQSMFCLIRSQDTIKVAVKLESRSSPIEHHRYLALVSTTGTQDHEESVILGIDLVEQKATIGLVLPIWGDLDIHLDGDGGYSVMSNDKQHIFKPVSVQAMWSSLQCLNKVRDTAARNNYLPDGLTHTWVQYYQSRITSDRSFIAEWHAMDDVESRTDLGPSASGNPELEKTIRSKLREMALTVDFEEVTSKQLRLTLEADLNQSLAEFRHFIDEEIVVIFRQMEAPSKIFDYLYLGSEWNASNFDELRSNGVGYILNVAREIDNFFTGSFKYLNIRVHDTEDADLLKHWDKTYRFISEAKNNQSKVLVHCKMGVSRSASTVVAFAMKEMSWTLDEALLYVQRQRSCVKPNKGFMKQLETYKGILDASKQRYNALWELTPTALQTGTALREASLNSSECGSDQLVGLASSVPNDSQVQHQSQCQDKTIASSGDLNPPDTSNVDHYLSNQGDSTEDNGRHPIPFPPWNEMDMSSRSESQDDLLSLDFDTLSESQDESIPSHLDAAAALGSSVTLLRYEMVDRDVVGAELPSPTEPTAAAAAAADVDSEEPASSKSSRPCRRGSYDVSMLAGYRRSSLCDKDDDDDAFFGEEECPLLHPDMVLETFQAEYRKKRQILKRLQQDRVNSADLESGNDRKDSADPVTKRVCRSSHLSESSEGANGANGPPMSTKLRPDNSWIRETVDDCETPADVGAQESAKVNPGETSTNSSELKHVHTVEATSSESHAAPSSIPSDFEKRSEDGVLLPDAAKCGKDIEDETDPDLRSGCLKDCDSLLPKVSEGGITQNSPENEVKMARSEFLAFGDTRSLSGHCDGQKLTRNFSESAFQRPRSIYETEDIELEPGIVLKTKREIELRERSCSSIDLCHGKESKSVQRSSSWRLDRSKSKDRNSERRRTCLPVLVPSPPSSDSLTMAEPSPGADDVPVSESGSWKETDLGGSNRTVFRIGLVEVARGIVKKTTKGFEEGLPIPLVVFTPEEPADRSPQSSSSQAVEVVPVEVGKVRRQTKNIETRYSSISPQTPESRVEADVEPRESEELGCSQSIRLDSSPTGAAAAVPSGDPLAGVGKVAARRDEHCLHLSLSQKSSSSVLQSFGSPDRPRKDLFSAPLDMTQKELNTRKASSPVKEVFRAIEGHGAGAQKQLPPSSSSSSDVVQLKQEPFRSPSSSQGNLSRGTFHSESERISSSAAKDLGSFSRTFSLRETISPSKVDSVATSVFNRSRSLRLERLCHVGNSAKKISAEPARNQGPLPGDVVNTPLSVVDRMHCLTSSGNLPGAADGQSVIVSSKSLCSVSRSSFEEPSVSAKSCSADVASVHFKKPNVTAVSEPKTANIKTTELPSLDSESASTASNVVDADGGCRPSEKEKTTAPGTGTKLCVKLQVTDQRGRSESKVAHVPLSRESKMVSKVDGDVGVTPKVDSMPAKTKSAMSVPSVQKALSLPASDWPPDNSLSSVSRGTSGGKRAVETKTSGSEVAEGKPASCVETCPDKETHKTKQRHDLSALANSSAVISAQTMHSSNPSFRVSDRTVCDKPVSLPTSRSLTRHGNIAGDPCSAGSVGQAQGDAVHEQGTVCVQVGKEPSRGSTCAQVKKVSKNEDNTCAQVKNVSKNEDNTCAQVMNVSKREDNTCAQVKNVSKNEDNTCARVKNVSKNEDITCAQVKNVSKREDSTCAQVKNVSKREDSTCTQVKNVSKREDNSCTQVKNASKCEDSTCTGVSHRSDQCGKSTEAREAPECCSNSSSSAHFRDASRACSCSNIGDRSPISEANRSESDCSTAQFRRSTTGSSKLQRNGRSKTLHDAQLQKGKPEELLKPPNVCLQAENVSEDQRKPPSAKSVHDPRESEKPAGELENRALAKCRRELEKGEMKEKSSGESDKVVQPGTSTKSEECRTESVATKMSGVIMRPKKPVVAQASSCSSDAVHLSWPQATPRSLPLHDEVASSSGTQVSKKLYGKSHPLTRLSTETVGWSLPFSN